MKYVKMMMVMKNLTKKVKVKDNNNSQANKDNISNNASNKLITLLIIKDMCRVSNTQSITQAWLPLQ